MLGGVGSVGMRPASELLHHPARVQVREDGVAVDGTEREVYSPIDERVREGEHLPTKNGFNSSILACTRTRAEDDEERERVGRSG